MQEGVTNINPQRQVGCDLHSPDVDLRGVAAALLQSCPYSLLVTKKENSVIHQTVHVLLYQAGGALS